MKDWRSIARASEPGIPEEEIDRVIKPLEKLEETFRPLTAGLTPDIEPWTGRAQGAEE